jgi:hypothetical protein
MSFDKQSQRNIVQLSFDLSEAKNKESYEKNNPKATKEYIFPNQKEDAMNIVEMFKQEKCHVISVQKKTKVGADGLMIYIGFLFTTDINDDFIINRYNFRIITGMSNCSWQTDMKEKAPCVFEDKVFHHGQLQKTELKDFRNSLIIIDEIDVGDKEFQVLHKTLFEAGLLDTKNMIEYNNKFIFISATGIKEWYDLYRWGPLHKTYKMTIPSSYIGSIDFLQCGIVQEFYPLNSLENAKKWIKEDIIDNYGNDKRFHLVRVTNKTIPFIQNACNKLGVVFLNHNSDERITEIDKLFKKSPDKHTVLALKNFFRRANFIPNAWKLLIGAVHDLYTKKIDYSVLLQALLGRMTGYWRDVISSGHKTGPYRNSIKAVKESENVYNDPYGKNSWQSATFNKTEGVIKSKSTMLSVHNIENLDPIDLPELELKEKDNPNFYRIYDDEETVRKVFEILGYKYIKTNPNDKGFRETSIRDKKSVKSLDEAVNNVQLAKGGSGNGTQSRRYYPCYQDITIATTLLFVVIIEQTENILEKLSECDEKFPSIPYDDLID